MRERLTNLDHWNIICILFGMHLSSHVGIIHVYYWSIPFKSILEMGRDILTYGEKGGGAKKAENLLP